jgi:prostaglandin-H2 D-isomerase / glutathione transferase
MLRVLSTRTTAAMMELKYFDGRGIAEVSRLMLAMADEPYTDTRYVMDPVTWDAPAFKAAKERGELVANLGRGPVLITDSGVAIGQSKAIDRFLAKKFGFMGKDDIEAAQIDCIAEHCVDVRKAQNDKGFSMYNKKNTAEEKETLRNEWFNTDLPTMLGKIEQCVAQTSRAKGFAVGSDTSYADVAIFALLKDGIMEAEQDVVDKAAKKCELLVSIANRIAQHEKVVKWIKTRPANIF